MAASIGIVSSGSYIPCQRRTAAEIAQTNPNAPPPELREKSIPAPDEDAVTLAIAAGEQALAHASWTRDVIGSLIVGSESHPYAVKPSATIVGQALGIGPWYMAVDTQFACKAGSAAIQYTMGVIQSGMADYGLAIGSDTAQGRPGDVLEYTAGAGAAAFILGRREEEFSARIDATASFTTNTHDFWRRPGQKYPRHGGRFTAEPAYFHHVLSCARKLFAITNTHPSDFHHVVLHQPNVKFPKKAAKQLGFTADQLAAGLLVPNIGNCYAAASLLGLAAVLEIARPGERIFFVSYGSGSGSDGLVLTKT